MLKKTPREPFFLGNIIFEKTSKVKDAFRVIPALKRSYETISLVKTVKLQSPALYFALCFFT